MPASGPLGLVGGSAGNLPLHQQIHLGDPLEEFLAQRRECLKPLITQPLGGGVQLGVSAARGRMHEKSCQTLRGLSSEGGQSLLLATGSFLDFQAPPPRAPRPLRFPCHLFRQVHRRAESSDSSSLPITHTLICLVPLNTVYKLKTLKFLSLAWTSL